MKHSLLRALSLLLWAPLVLSTSTAEDVTQTGVATVTLTAPYSTVLSQEVIRFTVAFRNDSRGNVPYMSDPCEAAGKQVFIKGERGDPRVIQHLQGSSVPDSERVRTVENDGKWEAVTKEATGELRPGQTVQWDGSRFDERLFRITLGKPRSMQAQVLVGPSRWVTSKSVPIRVVDEDVNASPVVFEGFYLFSFRGSAKTKQPVRIHRVTIEGKDYLFSSGCARICEIPKGFNPDFACDPETALVTVRFPGKNLPPVRYNYPQMRILPARPE